MNAGKKTIEEKQTILLKSMQRFRYCIHEYFIMWDVQPLEKKRSGKWVFVAGRKSKVFLAPIIVLKQ